MVDNNPLSSAQYDGLLDLMTPMSESQVRFLGCLYGDLGVGKTVLSAQVAKRLGGNWLYIDTADEFATLKNPQWQHLITDMHRMRYDGLSQIEAVSKAIIEKKPNFDFDGIILDKSSQMSARDLIRVTRSKQQLAGLVDRDPDVVEWPHRNIAAYRFQDALAYLLKTGCHIIHVAGMREDKDKLNIEKVGPGFPRSIYNAIADPMHLVAYVTADIKATDTNQEQYVRWVQTLPTMQVVAKNRIQGLNLKVSFDDLVEGIGAFARGERSLVESDIVPTNSNNIPVY